jgi:ribosomal protein S18 acetylase RimI-like enzyme/predicted RNA-binding protein with PUA-like domain
MDFLIDTNILIPAEPTSTADVEPTTPVVADLLRLVLATGGRAVVHPDAFSEIANDRDVARRELRRSLFAKYPRIDSPPALSDELATFIGRPEPGTHDALDARLLEAVRAGRADLLVSDDAGLHRRARLAVLGDRVLTSSEALELVRQLYEPPLVAPPAARSLTCAELDSADPIFDGLRQDYREFDSWLAKAARLRRRAWVVEDDDGSYAALVIINEETPGEHGLPGKLLKLCTFKVSDGHRGSRYGELLLKPVLELAHTYGYDTAFVEAKPYNDHLFNFLESFGFRRTDALKNGTDPVYAKALRPPAGDASELDPLAFHVMYGPPTMRWEGVKAFIVPIMPGYHAQLFPEAELQLSLAPSTEPHGNGIRKAYLSRSSTRLVSPGDVLYFYRSRFQELTVIGVVEDVHVLSEAPAIVQVAGKRMLYTYADIRRIAEDGSQVLVIGFRQARVIGSPVLYRELKEQGVLKGAPQTVTSIGEEAATWLAQRLQL